MGDDMIRIALAAAVLVLAMPAASQATSATPVLAFLETLPQPSFETRLRAAFRFEGGAWQPMPLLPRGATLPVLQATSALFPQTISVSHGGVILGGKLQAPKYFADIGVYEIASGDAGSLLVRAGQDEYVTWNGPRPFRPVPLSSSGVTSSPYAPVVLANAIRKAIIADVMSREPRYPFCEEHEKLKETRTVKADDIDVGQAYAAGGATFVYAGVPSRLDDCWFFDSIPRANSDGEVACQFCKRTYAIVGDRVVYLGGGLALIESGDFNGDGEVEHAFHYTAYNRSGYILYSPDFSTPVRYTWSYH
jgi:hypothetical protein